MSNSDIKMENFDYEVLNDEFPKSVHYLSVHFEKRLACMSIALLISLIAIFFTNIVILMSLGYGGVEASKCDQLVEKADKIEEKIYPLVNNISTLLPFLNNITQLMKQMSDTEVDMSAFALVSRVIVKNRKEVEDLFPFLNETKAFLKDSKQCVQKYDICPKMQM